MQDNVYQGFLWIGQGEMKYERERIPTHWIERHCSLIPTQIVYSSLEPQGFVNLFLPFAILSSSI